MWGFFIFFIVSKIFSRLLVRAFLIFVFVYCFLSSSAIRFGYLDTFFNFEGILRRGWRELGFVF